MNTEDLKHIAPILASLQNKGTGFTSPPTYFDSIENRVFDTLFTDSLPQESGSSIPDNYFDELEDKVISRLNLSDTATKKDDIPKGYFDALENRVFKRLEKEDKRKVIALKRYWIPTAIAASLLLIISIYNPFTENNNLEFAEIEEWIDAGNLELNSYEIAAIYNTEIDNIKINQKYNEQDLEDYLTDEISESLFYE